MIKYRGGKSREIPDILPYIPDFQGRYVEPFFGGGAMFFYLEPQRAIINDINPQLINFYRGVRDNYGQLRHELDILEALYATNRAEFDRLKSATPQDRVPDANEELYYRIRAMFNNKIEKEFSDAAIYYFINKTSYSGMIRYNARGEFNVPFGRYKGINTSAVTENHSRLLQRTDICNEDYAAVFNRCNHDDFLFLDPPYDCIFSDYGNEAYRDGFNEDSHRRLAEDFHNLPCRALMVIGCTPLTEELYGAEIVHAYGKNYSVNIRNRFKAATTHILVTNYDLRRVEPRQMLNRQPQLPYIYAFEPEERYGDHR